jgi:hypothetical protein
MKDRSFNNDEFEELIREKTGNYKMYPSDRVWREIFGALHARRRGYVAGMTLLICGILLIAGKELLFTTKHTELTKKVAAIDQPKNGEPADISQPFSAPRKVFVKPPLAKNVSESAGISADNVLMAPGEILALNDPRISPLSLASETPDQDSPLEASETPGMAAVIHAREASQASSDAPSVAEPGQALPSGLTDAQAAARIQRPETQAQREDRRQLNWLQDYAVNPLEPPVQHRLNWEIHLTPTVNYRTLSGPDYPDIKPSIPNVPVALIHFGNVNNFVDHSPAVGFQVGTSLLYRMTRNITLKAGLQFNYSRYYIKAYTAGRQPATLTLSSYYGYITDSLTTTIGNFAGNSRVSFQNKYYQIAAPIGVELRVFGNGKLQFHIGATVEPTYLLNTNSYLLTNDYTKYIKEPSLFRRWNVNGGLEAFLSYQVGGLRWQIGPQYSYQLLSTYKNQYPVQENLKEYGIKIAVSKQLR